MDARLSAGTASIHGEGNGGFAGSINYSGAGRLRAERLRQLVHRHRPQGQCHRCPLGAGPHREDRRLRLPRHSRDRREIQGHRSRVLRRGRQAFLLQQLLQRRAAGPDGSAALPGRLRRHHRRRTGWFLHSYSCVVHLGSAGRRDRSGQLHPSQQIFSHRSRGCGCLRRARRRKGRRD